MVAVTHDAIAPAEYEYQQVRVAFVNSSSGWAIQTQHMNPSRSQRNTWYFNINYHLFQKMDIVVTTVTITDNVNDPAPLQ